MLLKYGYDNTTLSNADHEETKKILQIKSILALF